MPKKTHVYPSDLRSVSRLTIDAIVGLADLVEAMHHTIARGPTSSPATGAARTRGITGLVYRSVRGVTRLVGGGLDALLAQVIPAANSVRPSAEREAVLAALNGMLGDYLAESKNELATDMSLRWCGQALQFDRAARAGLEPPLGGKLVVLVHGLCMNDLQWNREGHDHGAALARDLGYTPIYLRYNSGLHVSDNGRRFAELLEALLHNWPVALKEFTIIGHSMGGLVARSAWQYGKAARHAWPAQLKRLVFLGTPHHGAPLERGGNWIDILLGKSRYSKPFARLGKVRSAGITDLRHGYLVEEDWRGRDRFARSGAHRQALALPEGVRCYTIAATTGLRAGDLSDRLLGDGLVPLASALGRHREAQRNLSFPPEAQWVAYDMNHLDLLSRAEVYAHIKAYLS
jgi:pimeloyl-ACP methyl ester carboxylesterase